MAEIADGRSAAIGNRAACRSWSKGPTSWPSTSPVGGAFGIVDAGRYLIEASRRSASGNAYALDGLFRQQGDDLLVGVDEPAALGFELRRRQDRQRLQHAGRLVAYRFTRPQP